MLSHTTKLYVDGLPVDYKISSDGSTFLFEPIFNPHDDVEPPHFQIIKEGDSYIFNGVYDDSLKVQALEDMDNLFFKN